MTALQLAFIYDIVSHLTIITALIAMVMAVYADMMGTPLLSWTWCSLTIFALGGYLSLSPLKRSLNRRE